MEHDYKMNGLPVYKIGFEDFSYFIKVLTSGNRFLTRSIKDKRIVNYIKKNRNYSRDFYIEYSGIILDMRNI